MNLEMAIAVAAIIAEGPIVWWLTTRNRREDKMDKRVEDLEKEVDRVKETHASKDYVNDHIAGLKAVVNTQYTFIIEELRYIRERVDEK